MTTQIELARQRNPELDLVIEDGRLIVRQPWGDETLVLRPEGSGDALLAALAEVRLPPRLTALWHQDAKELEIIFGYIPETHPARGRTFAFSLQGATYECGYQDASERLRLIADSADPVQPPGPTDHRNLSPIRNLARLKAGKSPPEWVNELRLTSFFVRVIDLDEEGLVELLRHVNFYMHYFDRHTPLILIHEGVSRSASKGLLQFQADSFPAVISGRRVDPYLLGLWEGMTNSPEPVRRFIYAYQVIEYAGFYFVRDDTNVALRRILSSPLALADSEAVVRRLVELIADERLADDQKMQQAMSRAVDTGLLWKHVQHHADVLSAPTVFEGGLEVPALIRPEWKLEDFQGAWMPKLPDCLKRIRNALVHSREQRQSRCIAPTVANRRLLRPWTDIVSAVAEQIMVYGV